MVSRSELERWTHKERSALMRVLVELEVPPQDPTPEQRRLRVLVRTMVTAGAVLLVPWAIYLATTLPRRTIAANWRAAWVGFDVALVVALAVTAWLGWRRRQMVMVGLVISAVLLVCDAWFDVMLTGGSDRRWSVASALLVEIPVALLFSRAARMILMTTSAFVWKSSGRLGPVPPLRDMPIVSRLRGGRGVEQDRTQGLEQRTQGLEQGLEGDATAS